MSTYEDMRHVPMRQYIADQVADAEQTRTELEQARELLRAVLDTTHTDPWTLARTLADLQAALEAGELPYDVEHTAEALLDEFTDLPTVRGEFEPIVDSDEEPLPRSDEWASPGLPDCAVCGTGLDAGTDGLFCTPECRTEWRSDVVRSGETVPDMRGLWVDPDSSAAWWRAAAGVAR